MAISVPLNANLRFDVVLKVLLVVLLFANRGFSDRCGGVGGNGGFEYDEGSDLLLFHQDYSPPAPPPPPPHPPAVLSCEGDLGGVGSLDTTCEIVSNLNIARNMYIEGKGNFYILPNVTVKCSFPGCEFGVNVSGNFSMRENSYIYAGYFELVANNASFADGSAVNTTGLAGEPPPQTSGTPLGVDGAGGGYGGRGAACLKDTQKVAVDVWGGDAYGWSSMQNPGLYGSKGGTTSMEVDYGGGGGGRIMMIVTKLLEVNGSLLADGGDGGTKGGGGSGGSIYILANKMFGSGRISASGGNGFAGGGGGRISLDVFSRHDEPKVFVYGSAPGLSLPVTSSVTTFL